MSGISIQAELVPGDKAEAKANEFQHFQQTYGPTFEKATKFIHQDSSSSNEEITNEEEELSEESDSENVSFWDVLASLSMLVLWFQRSTFGAVGLIRSLVLGHCLQYFIRSTFGAVSDCNNANSGGSEFIEAETQESIGVQKYFRLMQSLLFGTGSSSSSGHPHKQINSSWPPPALVALAVLTILALVVHPDGLTWIMLRKIRDAFMSLLQSSSTCWAVMVRDFGVLGTVSASASIVLVLILAIVMHKAFLSNCSYNTDGDAASTKRRSAAAEKKRRRRKGHSNRGGRIKGGPNSTVQPSSPSILCPRLPKVEEVASDGASDSSGEMQRDVVVEQSKPSCSDETEKLDLDVKAGSDHQIQNEEEGASIMTSPSALESVVSEDFSARARTPVPSVCTVDTAVLSDDISCESFSVRSVQQQQQQQQQSVRHTKSRANKSKGNATRGGKANNSVHPGPKQPKTTSKTSPNARNLPSTPRFDTWKAKPSNKPNALTHDTPARFDHSNESYAQKRSDGGNGRPVSLQNSRKSRGKGGRAARSQKNQPTSLSTPITSAQNSKSSPNPYSAKSATVAESPVAQGKNGAGMNNSPDTRLPPISPYSQSLFSAESGASGWSLPALPAVTQSKMNERADLHSLTPALSYQTNPFVTPYSQMPNEVNSAGRVTPVAFAEGGGSSLGLWNSMEPRSTLSTAAYDLKQFTTPTRPVRPPPGLPSPPPGFSEASISQPSLSTGSEFSTPVSTFSKMHGTPTTGNSSPLVLNGIGFRDNGVGYGPVMSTANNFSSRNDFTSVKENPFAADKGGSNEAECRIEAELQELGGRMVGSVLDF